jgi:hypothetical protein
MCVVAESTDCCERAAGRCRRQYSGAHRCEPPLSTRRGWVSSVQSAAEHLSLERTGQLDGDHLCPSWASPRPHTRIGPARSDLIVGSGPTGATYARPLLPADADVSVLVVEAGPLVSDRRNHCQEPFRGIRPRIRRGTVH